MDETSLKPCPFCGSEADMSIAVRDTCVWAFIECSKCHANIQRCVARNATDKISMTVLVSTANEAAFAWDRNENVDNILQQRLDGFADRIEWQINETECKRDVFNLCKTEEEKARVSGFVDGLNWLLEIIDDEYTRHDEDDE